MEWFNHTEEQPGTIWHFLSSSKSTPSLTSPAQGDMYSHCCGGRELEALWMSAPVRRQVKWDRLIPECYAAVSSNRSKPHLRPTPQLTAMPHPQPIEQGQGLNQHPHRHYVGFVNHWATKTTPDNTSLYSWVYKNISKNMVNREGGLLLFISKSSVTLVSLVIKYLLLV